jgi:hypothetical protein
MAAATAADRPCVRRSQAIANRGVDPMTLSNQRILMQRGRIKLIESGNPVTGVDYAVCNGSIGIWRGESFVEAHRQFKQAMQVRQSN